MIKNIILILVISIFMISCSGYAGANYQMDKPKQERMHQDNGGGY